MDVDGTRNRLLNFFLVHDPMKVKHMEEVLKAYATLTEACESLSSAYRSKYFVYWDILEEFFAYVNEHQRQREIPDLLRDYQGQEETLLFSTLDKDYSVKFFSLRRNLALFYLQHNPTLVPFVNQHLKEHVGQEETFLKTLETQYKSSMQGLDWEGLQTPQRAPSPPRSPSSRTRSKSPMSSPHGKGLTKLHPQSGCFSDPTAITVVRLAHSKTGMWVKFPSSRCNTKVVMTADYEEASDIYITMGTIGDVKGFVLQSADDGRMLSADSNKRSWSPSPPRTRGASPLEELHLHTRRFGMAEIATYTQYHELQFIESGSYVTSPELDHVLHISVSQSVIDTDPSLWISPLHVNAHSWEFVQSQPSHHRLCRHCKTWYNSRQYGRCGVSHDARHESFLLPDWAAYDHEARDSAVSQQPVPTQHTVKTLPGPIMRRMFSFCEMQSVMPIMATCKGWAQYLQDHHAEYMGNKEWMCGLGLVRATAACKDEQGLPPKGLFPKELQSSKSVEKEYAVSCVLRHAASVASPATIPLVMATQQSLWDGSDAQSMRSKVTGVTGGTAESAYDTLRHGLKSASSEGVCFTSIICKKIQECLEAHSYPSDPETVHLISSTMSRSMTVIEMVRAFDFPAKLYASVSKAAAKHNISVDNS